MPAESGEMPVYVSMCVHLQMVECVAQTSIQTSTPTQANS